MQGRCQTCNVNDYLICFQSLLQDILSYQHLIDGIVSKAQLMAQTTNDTSIMPRVSRMNDVYVRLCSTAKVSGFGCRHIHWCKACLSQIASMPHLPQSVLELVLPWCIVTMIVIVFCSLVTFLFIMTVKIVRLISDWCCIDYLNKVNNIIGVWIPHMGLSKGIYCRSRQFGAVVSVLDFWSEGRSSNLGQDRNLVRDFCSLRSSSQLSYDEYTYCTL